MDVDAPDSFAGSRSGPADAPDPHAVHSQFVQRLAAIPREQTTRWQKLLGAITGGRAAGPGG